MIADFDRQLDAHRRELLVHCYRMLGSAHDAEDAVQDTMLRAWRAADRFDPLVASLRTWLYRIATNVCLTLAEQRGRRALPSDLSPASDDPRAELVPLMEVAWLQPLPDADPAAVVERREDLRLALVAAMQRLPARQRATIILRDTLGWSADETAAILDTSSTAVRSALQRARATLATLEVPSPGLAPDDPACRRIVDAYVAAYERADAAAIAELVTIDVTLEMPPVPIWFRGRDDYRRFMANVFERRPRWQVTVARANGQPALIAEIPGPDRSTLLHSYQVLDVVAGGVRRNTTFYGFEP